MPFIGKCTITGLYGTIGSRINPTNASAYANLGNILAIRGELEEAIENYRQALQVKPEFAEAHQRLGQLLTQYGNRDEAIGHLEEALRIIKSRPIASSPR